MNRVNDWLAVKLGNGLSSMYFFYFCLLLDSAELKPVISAHSIITWITYISQSVIQLVALPVLGAQQKIQEKQHNQTMLAVKKIHKHLGVK